MSVFHRRGFTLIELLVVIAIIAILAVVVVLTLNPAELLKQSRDANRVSDMATLTSALNLYTEDVSNLALGISSDTYPSVWDTSATSTNACPSLGMPSLTTSTGQAWLCTNSSTYRNVNGTGWIPVNFSLISSGSPMGNLPVDPSNQTSTGLFYAYNTNGSQFEVTANLESAKYKQNYGNTPQTSMFPEVISGGTPTLSALYNPSGLVGYWPLNEGTGSSTIDASGNGNLGTWSGTPIGNNNTYYTGGKVGTYAGDFDGSNDYFQAPTGTYFSGAFTITAWVNPAAFNSWSRVLDFGNGQGINNVLFAITNGTSGKPDLGIHASSGTWDYAPGPAIPLNQWSFLAASLTSGGTATIYENGVAVGTTNESIVEDNITRSYNYVGKSNWSADGYAQGKIDEVRIYGRALSPAEVMALYNAEK